MLQFYEHDIEFKTHDKQKAHKTQKDKKNQFPKIKDRKPRLK